MNCPECKTSDYYYGLKGHSCVNSKCVYFDAACTQVVKLQNPRNDFKYDIMDFIPDAGGVVQDAAVISFGNTKIGKIRLIVWIGEYNGFAIRDHLGNNLDESLSDLHEIVKRVKSFDGRLIVICGVTEYLFNKTFFKIEYANIVLNMIAEKFNTVPKGEC